MYVKSARRRKEDHGLCDVHTVLNNQRENKNKTKTTTADTLRRSVFTVLMELLVPKNR